MMCLKLVRTWSNLILPPLFNKCTLVTEWRQITWLKFLVNKFKYHNKINKSDSIIKWPKSVTEIIYSMTGSKSHVSCSPFSHDISAKHNYTAILKADGHKIEVLVNSQTRHLHKSTRVSLQWIILQQTDVSDITPKNWQLFREKKTTFTEHSLWNVPLLDDFLE